MDCAREALIDNRVIALCRAWGRGKPSVDALGVGARSNPRACIFSVITGAETPLAFDAGGPDTTPTDIGAGREGLGARSYFVTGVVRRSIFWIKERWVQQLTWGELDHLDRELVERAQEACARAYAPYSRFAVGAAVRSKSGNIHTAANLENASYGLTICAEAAALCIANAAGHFAVEAIAVVGFHIRDAESALQVVTPCGSCRQIIAEAARLTGSDIRLLCCNRELSSIAISPISELLPSAFGLANGGALSQWNSFQTELQVRVKRLIAARPKR